MKGQMRHIFLLAFFLLPSVAYGQDRLVKVKITETKRHMAITIKTPEGPINQGIQGVFRIQFQESEDYIVYNDKASKNGKVRRVEFDTPKGVRIIKIIFFVPGEGGNKPFGLAFGRNLFPIRLPGEPEENPSRLVFTVGEDADSDGFAGIGVVITGSQKWNLIDPNAGVWIGMSGG